MSENQKQSLENFESDKNSRTMKKVYQRPESKVIEITCGTLLAGSDEKESSVRGQLPIDLFEEEDEWDEVEGAPHVQ